MTKILIVHPRPSRGGFSAVVAQSHELLAFGGFEVTVAVAQGERLAELDPRIDVAILRRPLTTPDGLARLAFLVRRLRPDVLHLHGRQAGVLGRIVLRRHSVAEVLYTPHGTPWGGGRWRREFLSDAVERLLLRKTTRVLCVSRSEQAEWSRRDTSDKILHFPNLIDIEPDLGAGDGPASPRVGLGGFVLVPSGYHPQKRVEVVVQALALTPEPRPHVLVTGTVDDAAYREALKAQARKLGVDSNVEFAGQSHEVKRLMRDAALVVLPSYSEGLPIIGQEAISVGAKVAWSAIPPHFELFADQGLSFWSPEDLAEVLQGDYARGSVKDRRAWLRRQQREAREKRARFWVALRDRSPQ